MKYWILAAAIALCAIAEMGVSQSLTQAEWFFDNDPGQGNGTPLTISADDSVGVSGTVSVGNLLPGFHRFQVRYRDDLGRWGEPDGRFFYVLQTPASGFDSRTITQAEFFLNADPGPGNGTPLSITADDSVFVSGLIPLVNYPPGFHRFQVRYRDDLGRWGEPDGRFFYVLQTPASSFASRTITQAEYFLNTDPGPGNGTPLSVTADDSVFVSGLIPLIGYTPGFHRFQVRYRDDLGRWGEPDGRFFYISPPSPSPSEQPYLAGAEYFINQDPGFGNGIALAPVDGMWDEREETVIDTVLGIPAGMHWLGVRFRDNVGNWSVILADSFEVQPILVIHVSGSNAVLSWRSSGPMSYVYQSASSTGPFALLDSTSASTYTHAGILNNPATQRFYHVTENISGLSAFRLPGGSRFTAMPSER